MTCRLHEIFGHILWGWHILVLAVKVVLSAKLTRAGFVAFLFARSAVVTSLRGANLLAPYRLSGGARVLAHVRARGISALVILSSRRRRRRWWGRVERLAVAMVCRTDGVAVAVGHVAVGAMVGVHPPWTLVAAMIHRWRLRLAVDTDARSGALRLWHSSRLWSGGRPVGSDMVLGNVYGRRAPGAMRAVTGGGNGPWVRVGAYIRGR